MNLMSSILLPGLLWSLAAAISLSNCSTAPQCSSLVSAALVSRFGVINTTFANELVNTNSVAHGPVYTRLNQCLDIVCAIPLQSQLVGLDLSYSSINETLTSLGQQLAISRQVWSNCTTQSKVNKTLNCDLQNRLMGRINEKMESHLRDRLAIFEELEVQCQGNVVCESYVGLQINSTMTQIAGQLSFENANVGFANQILNCSESGGDCLDVLSKSLASNFTVSVKQFGSLASVINQTGVYVAFRDLLLVAPSATNPILCLSYLWNFTAPVLEEFEACRGVKNCIGQTLFTKLQSLIRTAWRRTVSLRTILPGLTRWCVTESCLMSMQRFQSEILASEASWRDLYFQFTANSPRTYTRSLVIVGILFASILCVAALALLIAACAWRVTFQQIFVTLIVLLLIGELVHFLFWTFLLQVISDPLLTSALTDDLINSFGALNRFSMLTLALALGLFVYEFFRGVYTEVLHREEKDVKFFKWCLLIGAGVVTVLTLMSLSLRFVIIVDGPVVLRNPDDIISKVNRMILLLLAFAFSIGLMLLTVMVLRDKKAKYRTAAIRMLFVALVLSSCMVIRVVIYLYDDYGPVFVSRWVYFVLLSFCSEFLAVALLLLAIFFRFYSFRARQIMSKSMQELNEPLLNRDSDNDIDELVDKPIPLRYRI